MISRSGRRIKKPVIYSPEEELIDDYKEDEYDSDDDETSIEEEEESTETLEGFICDTCGEEKRGEAFIRTLPPARMTITCGDCYDKGSVIC